MFVHVLCEVSNGLRPQEATVKFTDWSGKPEYLPIDRDMVACDNGRPSLPVRVLHIDRERNAALISLPVEADSGAHRIWVRLEDVPNLPKEFLA